MALTPEEAMKKIPHLISPAHLAIADTDGKWFPAPHLRLINNELVKAWRTPNARLAINVPFQHGKSWLGSVYFPAWVLLRWPQTRIALASYEETFATNFGSKVKDIVDKFGPALGIELRDDSQSKGEWVIAGYGGGMVCKGRGGALVGRPADLLILDDLIKNAEEAQSPTILEGIWDWYCTVAYSRLGPTAPIIGIGTRWGPNDIFGHWIAEAKNEGDKFEFVNLKAIAEGYDPLGRQPGEALWPDRVPLHRLEKVRKMRPRWFKSCWQGEPEETHGLHYQPREWPTYTDVGDAWRIYTGVAWHNYRKVECAILHAVDWAQAGRKKSDRTAVVTAAITPDSKVLILDVTSERLRYEDNAPLLQGICRQYARCGSEQLMQVVASDDDNLSDTMMVDCRRYPGIPEIKRLPIRARSKIVRAQAAIIRSQNGLFFMPATPKPWFESTADQLSSFTGEEGAEDDIADCFGILGRLADDFDVEPADADGDYDSVLGSGGYAGIDGGW